MLVSAGWGWGVEMFDLISVLYFYNKALMENGTGEICCGLCLCSQYSPSLCGWDRRPVHSGGISPGPETGTA